MNWFTATVAMRPLAMRLGSTAPARSTWAMIQPPKMSPLALTSAGSGITRSTSSRPSGRLERRHAAGSPAWRVAAVVGHRGVGLAGSDNRCMPWSATVRRGRRADATDCPPMRSHATHCPLPRRPRPARRAPTGARWRKLLPYLWRYRWRVGIALAFLVAAKVANVGVPLLLKHLVDALVVQARRRRGAAGGAGRACCWPMAALRLSTTLFTELRELIFAKATEGTARSISLQVFRHLHALSLRFHLERQTGGMTRDIERGTRAVHSLISYSLYSIVPDADRGGAGADAAGGEVRRLVRLDHARRAGALHHLHHHA